MSGIDWRGTHPLQVPDLIICCSEGLCLFSQVSVCDTELLRQLLDFGFAGLLL